MRVMISQPMNGKTNDQIKKEREEVINKFKDLHIDVFDTIIEECADPDIYNDYHPALFYMAKSIDFMAQVDAIYFMNGWQNARGCRIERKIAEEYNVKILESSFLYPKDEPLTREYPNPNNIRIVPYGTEPQKITKPDYTITSINNEPYNDNAIKMLDNLTQAHSLKGGGC